MKNKLWTGTPAEELQGYETQLNYVIWDSSAQRDCDYLIKNTEILLQFKTAVFYVNIC